MSRPKALSRSEVVELSRHAAVGARIHIDFESRKHRLDFATWTGTITQQHRTFVTVKWDQYPKRELILPIPAGAGVLTYNVQIDTTSTVLAHDGSAGSPAADSSRAGATERPGENIKHALRIQHLMNRIRAETESIRRRLDELLGEDSLSGARGRTPASRGCTRAAHKGTESGKPPSPFTTPPVVRQAQNNKSPCRPEKTFDHRCTCGPECGRVKQEQDAAALVVGDAKFTTLRPYTSYRSSTPLYAALQTAREEWKVPAGIHEHAHAHYRGINPLEADLKTCTCECVQCNRPDPVTDAEAVRIKKLQPRVNPAFPGKGEPTIGGYEPTEPTFVFSSGTTTVGWRTGDAALARAPEPRVERNAGILGQIVCNKIKIAEVLELDVTGEAAEVVNILLSLSAFESHIKTGFRPQTRISRFMAQHTRTMTASGLLEEAPRDFGTNYMPLFTVPKKDETLRLIQDDRHLNEWFDRPPKMNLPRIHDVIDTLMRNEFFAQCDAKSWFYQIPLHPDTHKYFGAILGGGRGPLKYTVMTKLPMGFSWAPCIAQRISNVIMRGVGLAWVDNYIIVGRTEDEFAANRKTFLGRIHKDKCNVVVDNESLDPVRSGETLGIEVDLEHKRFRMSEKWVEKIKKRGIPTKWTPRTFSKAMGGIIWCSHVTKRGLCMQPHLMRVLGDIMRRIALRQVKWDDGCEVTKQAMTELDLVMKHIEENAWVQWKERKPHDMDIWADASSTHSAYLIVKNYEVIAALVRETRGKHIFLEELSIALDAVAEAYRLGAERVRLFEDNAPAAGCIEKNVSTNFEANTFLRAKKPIQVDVTWVSTKYMLADPYTRGVTLPAVHSAAQDLHLYNAASENSELRAQGHHTFKQRTLMCVCEVEGQCLLCCKKNNTHEHGNVPVSPPRAPLPAQENTKMFPNGCKILRGTCNENPSTLGAPPEVRPEAMEQNVAGGSTKGRNRRDVNTATIK